MVVWRSSLKSVPYLFSSGDGTEGQDRSPCAYAGCGGAYVRGKGGRVHLAYHYCSTVNTEQMTAVGLSEYEKK
jgi:hypothetical protein